MMRLLVWIALFYLGYRIVRHIIKKDDSPPEGGKGDGAGADVTFRDPVCGLYVSGDDAVIGRLEGKRIHFCSMECLDKFRETLEHTKREGEHELFH